MAGIKLTFDMKRFQRDLKRVQRQLELIKKRAIAQAQDGMGQEAKTVLTRAKELTPVKTGRLRASGKVRKVKTAAGGIENEVLFTAPYAVAVHERTDLVHKQGRSQFLRIASKEQVIGLPKRIAARIQKVIRKIK